MKTVFRCSHCGKWLSQSDQDWCWKYDENECTECMFLEDMGIHTIEEYNEWLKENNGQAE